MGKNDDLEKLWEEVQSKWQNKKGKGSSPFGDKPGGAGGGGGGPRGPGAGMRLPGNFFNGRTWLFGVLLVLGFIALSSSYYTVEPEEVGVVTRFGRYSRQTAPGLHVKWPWGIEAVERVRILEIHKEEFGFRTKRAAVRTEYSKEDFPNESLMLTADLSIADVEWIVQYRISDPKLYLFNIRSPEQALRDASEAVMREVVGDRTVTEVLTEGRSEINSLAESQLQDVLDRYECGLKVVTVKLQDVTPPDRVKGSFNEVNQARQEGEETINSAWATYNKQIPLEEGKAQQSIAEAEGYLQERVNRAQGDAERFLSEQAAYALAPEVTRKRLYLEMVTEVLGNLDRKILTDPKSGNAPFSFLNLDGDKKGGL